MGGGGDRDVADADRLHHDLGAAPLGKLQLLDRVDLFLRCWQGVAEGLGERFEGFRGVEVGADFERILALEFEESGDVFEDSDDFVFVHRV